MNATKRTPLSISRSPRNEPFCTIQGSVEFASFAAVLWDRSWEHTEEER